MTATTERPVARVLLPIRIEKTLIRGCAQMQLVYDGHSPQGVKQSYTLLVGPPLEENLPGCYRDPLGVAVIRVMQAFWNLEARVDGILRERDEARQEANERRADLLEARDKIHGLESRLKDLTKNGTRKG